MEVNPYRRLMMAITIKQHQEKWRMVIINEEWEFKNLQDMLDAFEDLIEIKKEYGRLDR